MTQGPLSAEQLEWLDDVLAEYGNDDSVLDASELDGLLTAVVTPPQPVAVELWLPTIWGGDFPDWESEEQFQTFMNLVAQQTNDIVDRLRDYPDQFDPLFGTNEMEGQEFTVVEDWCVGYMKGVALGDWSTLPEAMKPALATIALHGQPEQNAAQLETLTAEDYEESVSVIRAAALKLAEKWQLH
ncbi:UPF0149 family protein [Erwinia sp. B116]|uniref:UPF0149 family protein n=1 Tax=Erwinia sp. B116 TaxID=1561024 RepID=UPI000C7872C7|nr:UPF0149 family protein [Erwinia sp. B116]